MELFKLLNKKKLCYISRLLFMRLSLTSVGGGFLLKRRNLAKDASASLLAAICSGVSSGMRKSTALGFSFLNLEYRSFFRLTFFAFSLAMVITLRNTRRRSKLKLMTKKLNGHCG